MSSLLIYKAVRWLLRVKDDTIPKLYLQMLLPKAPAVVDAGAHTGSDTVEMSHIWPQGTIYAFEPVPAVFQKLVQNTKDCLNIHCYQLALSTATGTAEMYVSTGEYDASSSLLRPKEHLAVSPHVSFLEHIPVATLTLDEWASQNGVPQIDFLWLDMQGAELAMLQAAPNSLAHVSVIHLEITFLELYDKNPLHTEVCAWLESQGFRQDVIERTQSSSGQNVGGNALFIRHGISPNIFPLISWASNKIQRLLQKK